MFKRHSKIRTSRTDGTGVLRDLRGVTLIESAMVIGIISLVILGALLALETVTEQRRMTQTAQDIALIRSAVSKYTAGGLVTYPATVTGRNMADWDDISGFLPGSLGLLADGNATLTMATGNPWSEDYIIVVPTAATASAKWTLHIHGIPDGLAPILIKQLTLNGARFANMSGDTVTCDPTVTLAAVAGGRAQVCVSYEE